MSNSVDTTNCPALLTDSFDKQLERALQEESLTEAMAFLCICEATRIAKQVAGSPTPAFDSHFMFLITRVREAWLADGKPLRDFQPRFCPPPPAH